MTQTEFNKKEQFDKLISSCVEKNLTYHYILEEVKRLKWNVNEKQCLQIADTLKADIILIYQEALNLNILNVSNKLKKAITKQLSK